MYRRLFMTALVLLLVHDAHAACGDTGSAYFNTHNKPQGLNGELYYAARCFVLEKDCNRSSLPVAARGVDEYDSDNVRAFYGANISRWCTGRVELFDSTFSSMLVSCR